MARVKRLSCLSLLLLFLPASLPAQSSCTYIGQIRVGPSTLGRDFTTDSAGLENLEFQIATQASCAVLLEGLPEWIAFGALTRTSETVAIDGSRIENARHILFGDGSLQPNDTGETRVATVRVGQLTLTVRQWKNVVLVSSASYLIGPVARASLVSLFGRNLSPGTESSSSLPFPEELAGTRVLLRSSSGYEAAAPLIVVSPNQVNFLIPDDFPAGPARVAVVGADGDTGTVQVRIASVAPGIFTLSNDGKGVPSGYLTRIHDGQEQLPELLFQFDDGRFSPKPIDLGPDSDRVFLVLYGTGFRYHTGLDRVKATIGGLESGVVFAAGHAAFAGVDQVNIEVPRSLAGAGEVDLILTVDGISSNPVRVAIQ